MAIDGTGIFASDQAFDLRHQIQTDWDAGVDVGTILAKVNAAELELSDDLELEIHLAASARALWDIGELESERAQRLAKLVASESSLVLWRAALSERGAKTRRTVLEKLLGAIAAPNPKPTSRKPPPLETSALLQVGDCIEWAYQADIVRLVCCRLVLTSRTWNYLFLLMSPEVLSSVNSVIAGSFCGRAASESPFAGLAGVDSVFVPTRELRLFRKTRAPFGRIGLNTAAFGISSRGPLQSSLMSPPSAKWHPVRDILQPSPERL